MRSWGVEMLCRDYKPYGFEFTSIYLDFALGVCGSLPLGRTQVIWRLVDRSCRQTPPCAPLNVAA